MKPDADQGLDPVEREERARLQRIEWIAEAGRILRAHGGPAATFVGSAISAMLSRGGSVERYLRIRSRRGSHRTVRWMYENRAAFHRDEGADHRGQQDDGDGDAHGQN